MRIGIDFGTCNSVAAIWNEGEKRARIVEINGSRQQASCIAISRKNPEEIVFGIAARDYRSDPGYLFYDRFKMLLNVRERSRWEEFGWPDDPKAMTPPEVSKAYLSELFSRSLESENKSKDDLNEIEQLVLSVPAVWTQEAKDNYGREQLLRIAIELLSGKKLSQLKPRELQKYKKRRVRIVSEPTAACCYFAHCYRINNPGKTFNGHTLVCDYGGGTLDLSLCKVEDDQVSVLDCRGYGHVDGKTFGAAGMAFDEEVVRRYLQLELSEVKRDDNWERWLRKFEIFKIRHISPRSPNERVISRYLGQPDRVLEALRPVPEGADKKFFPAHLVQAFESVIEPRFKESVSEMLQLLVKKEILREQKRGDRTVFEGSSEKFRILFVGGFSSFMLVQAAMTRYLGYSSMSGLSAGMLDSVYPTSERKPSVALGATLLAAQKISYHETCPVELGAVLHPDILFSLVDPGSKIESDKTEPDKKIAVNAGGVAEYANITLWMRNNRGILTKMPLEQTCADVFLHRDELDNLWNLGFLVGEGLVISLWVQDKNHKETQVIQLGDLIAKYSGIVIQPNDPSTNATDGKR